MDPADIERIVEWDSRLDDTNYYELLGVLEIADEAAIRRAFHEFAAVFHPDVHPGADAETAGAIRRVFQRGTEAYRVLVRPDLRAAYDLVLAKGQLRLDAESAAPPQPSHVRSLDDLCRSAAAKLHARNADRAIGQGNLALAKRELLLALRHEEEQSPELLERLDALDLALFAMGQ